MQILEIFGLILDKSQFLRLVCKLKYIGVLILCDKYHLSLPVTNLSGQLSGLH